MEQERGAFEIPAEFADYRRRLIIYSERRQLRVDFAILVDSLVEDLKEFEPSPTKMEFDVGNIAVTVLHLRNERRSVGEAIAQAQAQPRFANLRLEGDARMVVLQQTVDDPYYRQQWALQKIEAEAAWVRVAEVTGRPPATVAIIDSGIKKDHEDLDPATIDGVRIIPPPPNNGFADDTGHGTMLAGTIAAVANNRKGITGVARNVRIYALKFTDTLTPPTALAGVLGILDAVAKPVKVINASWHVLEDTGLLAPAILFAGSQGCVVVVAAGNYGSNNTEIPTLPASYGFDNMVVVMASDRDDDKCWFSDYGSTVDLAAPGEAILSTGLYYVTPAYREYSGTSAAAAHVSGAAALLLAIDDWTPREIREHLVASADPLRSLVGTCRANGRLNLRRAVLGPFTVVKPAAGEQLVRGSSYDVQWTSEYVTPVVNSVEIFFIDRVTGAVLGQFSGLPNNGHRQVVVPNHATAQAMVRVKCEQKKLYGDSASFAII